MRCNSSLRRSSSLWGLRFYPFRELCCVSMISPFTFIVYRSSKEGTHTTPPLRPIANQFNSMQGKIFSTLVASILFSNIHAQQYQWGVHYGGVGEDVVRAMAADASGNVYTVGYFTDSSDFDPGPGVHQITSNGFFDIFVQKLDTDGNLVWARGFGGGFYDYATGIDVDDAGNVWVTGVYQETVDFDPGPDVFELTSSGGEEIFALKLSASGDFLWAGSMGSTGYEEPTSISVDNTGIGSVYVSGYFSDPMEVDPGMGTFTLTSNGGQDIFVIKLDAAGDFQWALNVGGTEQELALGMEATDNGTVHITGLYNGTVDFDPGVGTANHTSSGQADSYVLKLNADGNFVNVATFGGPSDVQSWDLDVDADGNAYAAGGFVGSLTAGTTTLTSEDNQDVFVVKVDPQGDVLWAKAVQGMDFQQAFDVRVTSDGNVVAAGYFAATADFDPSDDTELEFTVESGEPFDAFYLMLDTDGEFISAGQFGGSNFLEHHGVAADGSGNFYLASAFQGDVDLDPSPNEVDAATVVDFRDTYVIKMSGVPTGLIENAEMTFQVWPNPAKDHLWVKGDLHSTAMNYRILDADGRLVQEGRISPNGMIPVHVLEAGAYILHISGVGSMKWLKQ